MSTREQLEAANETAQLAHDAAIDRREALEKVKVTYQAFEEALDAKALTPIDVAIAIPCISSAVWLKLRDAVIAARQVERAAEDAAYETAKALRAYEDANPLP